MIQFRRAGSEDVPALIDLIERGFSLRPPHTVNSQEGMEHRILFSYLYSLKGWDPARVQLAEENQQPVAAVGFFPQTLSLEGALIPVWAISPVVTHPGYRGRDLAGECLRRGTGELREQGIPAVFLWGLPDYYPRFGFVPLLPRYRTRLNLNQSFRWPPLKDGAFRPAVADDWRELASLYDSAIEKRWLQPVRTAAWWRDRLAERDIEEGLLREVPFPIGRNLLVWEAEEGRIGGYLYFKEEIERRSIIITEAEAADAQAADGMLRQLVAAVAPEYQTLVVQGTPEHLFNQAAYRIGGTHWNPVPRFGMVKVLDWPLLLRQFRPLLMRRAARLSRNGGDAEWRIGDFRNGGVGLRVSFGNPLEITLKGEPREPEVNRLLTRVCFGFYDDLDLQRVTGDIELLRGLFPLKYPFIWDANYLY